MTESRVFQNKFQFSRQGGINTRSYQMSVNKPESGLRVANSEHRSEIRM